jgi:hypothetical protein
MSSGVVSARHVDRLGWRPTGTAERGHHPHVGRQAMLRVPLARLEGTVEHRQVLLLAVRRPFDRVVLVDVRSRISSICGSS